MRRSSVWLSRIGRLQTVLLAGLPLFAILAFGAQVSWALPVLAAATFLAVLSELARRALIGRWSTLRSPLGLIGLAILGLGIAQSLPLPQVLAERLSPNAHRTWTRGAIPSRILEDAPNLPPTEAASSRTPATLDRSATFRWIVGGAACWILFILVGHHIDGLGRLRYAWGGVVVGLLINTCFGAVQLLGDVSGWYAGMLPGFVSRYVEPGPNDLMESPGWLKADPITSARDGEVTPGWMILRPLPRFEFGTLIGGAEAYVALAALALPLALGLILQMAAPRGQTARLWGRLQQSGQTGPVVVMLGLTTVSALLMGALAGPMVSLSTAACLALLGIAAAAWTGLGLAGLAFTTTVVGGLAVGIAVHTSGMVPARSVATPDWSAALSLWDSTRKIFFDFPCMGSGVGTFATVIPYYKEIEPTPTVAGNSGFQWLAEAGFLGFGLAAAGFAWCLWRLPSAIARVGSADRALACGLAGAILSFGIASCLQTTVQFTAVALSACVVGGTAHRWLAGGTDLFLERMS